MKTKMIKIKITAVLVLLLSTASCNFLDVVPDNIAVIEDAFKTRDNAERFLGSLYSHLPPFNSMGANPALNGGDETLIQTPWSLNSAANILKRGGQTVNNVQFSYWGRGRNLFIGLRDCNIFMANLDKPFDLLEAEKIRWIAEAKFLKAYYHFWLLRMYGPMPIIKENINVGDGVEAVKVVRQPVDEVTAYIVQLLDEAIKDLPVTIVDDFNELGRITKGIALAVKARVLVTMASPLFNGNPDYAGFKNAEGKPLIRTEYDPKKWEDAVLACKEAIEEAHANGHKLYEFEGTAESRNWSDETIRRLTIRGALTERWNDEIVWDSSGRQVSGLQSQAQAILDPQVTGRNANSTTPVLSATLRIAEMFYSDNGVPIEEDKNYDHGRRYQLKRAEPEDLYRIKPGYETVKLHFNREPRFYASLGFDGGIWIGHGVEDDKKMYHVQAKSGQISGNGDPNRDNATGYFPKKWVYYKNVQQSRVFSYSITTYPFPVIRLADLYLLYAEALNETDKTTEAILWIDRVRTRAGLKGVVESWSKFSRRPNKPNIKEGLRDIIQRERMIELVFEGARFWDIRRWKLGIELLNGELRGWDMTAKESKDYYTITNLMTIQFQQRDYLWPIAERDVIANNKLIQNPGWGSIE